MSDVQIDHGINEILKYVATWGDEVGKHMEPRGYSELEIATRVSNSLRALDEFLKKIDRHATPVTYLSSGWFSGPSGVYFLLKGSDVVYVGQSKYIVSRVSTHSAERMKDFDRVAFIEVEPDILDQVENYFIQTLDPDYNCVGRASARLGQWWKRFSLKGAMVKQDSEKSELPEWLR